MKNTLLNLTNCQVNLRYEHNNYMNGRLRMIVRYKRGYLPSVFISGAVLAGNDAVKKIYTQLNNTYTFSFTNADCIQICKEGKLLMQSGKNVATHTTVDAVLRKIYRYHLENCMKYHMNGLSGLKNLTYIEKNKGVVYLCIQYKELSDIFETLGEDWKPSNFKREVEAIYNVWQNGGCSHRGLYQNKSKETGWSLRVPLMEIIRN